MINGDQQRLKHIQIYCEDIASFIERFGKNYEVFISDRAYFNAVSMCILQIGELANGLSAEFREKTKDQMPWNVIRGMRNWLAHAYNEMEETVIWKTAINDIPSLALFCDRILAGELENSVPSTDRQKSSVLKRLEENKKIVAEQSERKSSSKKRLEPER